MGASFDLSYTVLSGNSVISKNKGTSLWSLELCSTFGHKISLRYIDFLNVYVLSTWLEKGGRSGRDKLDRRRSTKLTVPPSSDSQPLVYHSDRQGMSTSRLRRAGQLATADICFFFWDWILRPQDLPTALSSSASRRSPLFSKVELVAAILALESKMA